jgi:drug/metabolite transporter (DMT)-like permease
MTNNLKAHIAIFLANFFYGLNYVIVKSIMPLYISPIALTFLRIMPVTILFWIVGAFNNNKITDKKDFKNLFFASIFGVFLNMFLFIKGLNFSTPIDAAIIMTTNPILVLVVAAIVLHEKISILKIIGIIAGAAGALILVGGKGVLGFNQNTISGDLLLLANSVSFAIYLAIARPLMIKYDSITVLKWVFLFGSIMFFPVGFNEFKHVQWHAMGSFVFLTLGYIIFVTTFLTYLLINYSLKFLRSTTVSIYIYIQPVISAIFAVLIGMDKFTILNITASSLVFTGVYLVSRDGREKKLKQTNEVHS